MKKNYLNKLFIILFIISLFGCKSYFNLDKIYYNTDNEIIIKSKDLNFSIPTKISFTGSITNISKTYKVSGYLKIKDYNNFQIFLNSRTLGIEIARLEFFNDSIIFINKISKTTVKSKISELSYLKGFGLNTNKILRILTGRGFEKINYNQINNTNKFKYNDYSLTGIVNFYNFGYLKTHNITTGTNKINILYSDYYRKNKLPVNIIGNIFTNNSNFSFDFKYTTIVPLKSKFVHLATIKKK
jgi:hypothetical protein